MKKTPFAIGEPIIPFRADVTLPPRKTAEERAARRAFYDHIYDPKNFTPLEPA